MKRSAGVTTSAVVVLTGSALTILCGALILLGSAFMPKSAQAANVPVNLGAILGFEAIFVFGFGSWGLATGIGLLYLKQWARISLLIYAGLLVFFSLPIAALMLFIPLPAVNDPNLPSNFASGMRIGMALFYAVFAALGGLWLYFFSKRSVKVQFQAMPAVPESAAGDSFLGEAVPSPIITQAARPLSITIIAWFLLIGSAFAPLGLLVNRTLFSGGKVPFYFLGFFFFGESATVILILWMAAQMVAAVGLLKLRKWGLYTAIGLQSFAAANAGLLLVIPGHRARFQQIMETMMATMNARMPQPAAQFSFPTWIGFAMSFPMVLLILWFLITRRGAFTSA